jgi:vitamin B12 transporter
LNGELGLRYNNHSEYGGNWTFNIAPFYNINGQVKLLASLSSGFKAPTLNELFGPFGANTDLKPQKSLTFDTGVEFRSADSRLSAGVIYFRRDIEDLISYDGSLGYININEQNDSGLEVSAEYQFPTTQVKLFYNYLDGAITQDGEETDNLIRRPDHQVGSSINQRFGENLQAGLSGKFVGQRNDLFFNSQTFTNDEVELGSYVLLDARVRYNFLNEKLTIFASVNNILNSEYTEVYGFNTRGTYFKGGLKFSY